MSESSVLQRGAGGAGRARSTRGGGSAAAVLDRPALVAAFLVSAVIPVIVNLGPLRLTPIRLLLLVMFLPLFFGWVSGKYGGIKRPDVFVLLYCIWMSLALLVNHGADKIEFLGISVVEAFAPYLLARSAIRTEEGFKHLLKIFLIILVTLFPFVVLESLTNRLLINDVARMFGGTFGNAPLDPRWGLERAQGPFEHPILYGVFVSMTFGLFWYGLGPKVGKGRGFTGAGLSGAAIFFSLSMGAWVSLITQLGLIGWNKFTAGVKRRWKLLLILSIFGYVVVDLLSNRTPFHVFIEYGTFNVGNAYNRILIFENGMINVRKNPVFGLGLNEWERAPWMSSSMDNFWLVQAVRYGIPGFIFMSLAFVTMSYQLGMLEIPSERAARYRKGLLVTFGGIAMAICTVHLWNASFCVLMFMLGSGAWMLDRDWPSGHAYSADMPPAPGRGGASPGGDRSRSGAAPASDPPEAAMQAREPGPAPESARKAEAASSRHKGPVRPGVGGRAS